MLGDVDDTNIIQCNVKIIDTDSARISMDEKYLFDRNFFLYLFVCLASHTVEVL